MRPTVSEALQAVRRVVDEVLVPDLGSDVARVQAAHVMATLDDLERHWASVVPNLMEENDDLEVILSRAADLGEDLGPLHTRISTSLEEAEESAPYPVHADLAARNTTYRGLLADLVPVLHRQASELDPSGELRSAIRGHLRKYLDRDL